MEWKTPTTLWQWFHNLLSCISQVMTGKSFGMLTGAWTSSFAFLIWSANELFIAMFRNSQIMCTAATNISGDIPESGGMSQYEKVIETLTTLFPVWVCLRLFFNISSQKFLISYLFGSLKVDWLSWAGHLGGCCRHLQASCCNDSVFFSYLHGCVEICWLTAVMLWLYSR